MTGEKNIRVKIIFYTKNCLPVITGCLPVITGCLPVITGNQTSQGIKYIVSCTRTYTLEKTFFAVATLKVCKSFLFRQNKTKCAALWSVRVFFGFSERGKPNNNCF